ncbi:polyketide cyclase/dehydrase and lipid transport domain-containing protein [Rhizoctonia solani]|uniref:Polyketide cyclase/dehydrase and lipid transport domain-containing protein n=1 Tax=Rhizoctonia solani TaxID=456999 RepID=A0A8H8NQB8_9AGAM|nr:polyketide cyclase/dehydrase and lipid transport domain-containing protein [Rhizoctonia solani]QRW16521.1 polyketide cyclase/dehydrase and lipid transport domain-containing protein [Rhizoctonia solani]
MILRTAARPQIYSCVLRNHQRTFFSLPNFSIPGSGGSSNDDSGTQFHTRKILPYTQRQLYSLVADVNSYHFFLPFCTNSRVLTSPPPGGFNTNEPYEVQAELEVGFMGMKESYVSLVRCRPWEMVQAVAASSTPLFKHLETTWRFQPASASSPHPTNATSPPSSTDIESGPNKGPTLLSIDLDYQFLNPLHAVVSKAAFERVSGMMVEAFERRCLEVYGKGKE